MSLRVGAAVCISCLVSVSGKGAAYAATLPEHPALRVLVVSDEVNPNNLSDADLTQPGDISAALNAEDSGLNLTQSVTEVSSQCVDDALTALESAEPPDVVVYFAHRGALGCDGQDRQAQFTADIEQLLVGGGGLVVFHHGIYAWAGKDAILDLIGGEANSIGWNTDTGQRVFNVAPDHFVSSNGLSYDQRGAFEGVDGVAAGDYPYFDNIPDERYPDTSLIISADETREILFTSDSGGARVLGYALTRPGWQGRVVAYQPGEYQPNALDDRAGRNFQILANAILYSTGAEAGAGGAPASGGDAGTPTEGSPDPTDEGTSTPDDDANGNPPESDVDSTDADDGASNAEEGSADDGSGGPSNDDGAETDPDDVATGAGAPDTTDAAPGGSEPNAGDPSAPLATATANAPVSSAAPTNGGTPAGTANENASGGPNSGGPNSGAPNSGAADSEASDAGCSFTRSNYSQGALPSWCFALVLLWGRRRAHTRASAAVE